MSRPIGIIDTTLRDAHQCLDDMLAAGPMRTEYLFEAPLVRLVRQLAADRKVSRIYVSRSSTMIV